MCVVEIPDGRLRGRREDGVLVFRGIPYARPPVGEFRFAPPAPPEPWSGIRDALRFSPAAPQMGAEAGAIGKLLSLVRGGISEDCLYLNVWTEGLDEGARPVLVFIHGGAFLLGAGSTFPYAGSRFAAAGVVLVTFNYRLGAFGFLDLHSLAAEGGPPANLGLRDQIRALEWVRSNVRQFGGDPGNVTIYGESAGAMSAATHLGIERPRRFRRAILSSGAAANVSTPERAEYVGRRFLESVSVRADSWRRLRELPFERILAAQRSALQGDPAKLGALPWQPTVDGDLITRQPLEAVRTGSAREVDLLIGTNREEWKLFALGALRLRRMDEAGLRLRVERLLGTCGADPAVASELMALHDPGAGVGRRRYFETWISIRTEQYFLLPAIELAEAHASSHAGTWVYRLDFPAPYWPRFLGSCHGLDLGVVFGTYRHPLFRLIYGNGAGVKGLSVALNSAWSGFASQGEPSWSEGPAWGSYDSVSRRTMILDTTPRLVAGESLEHRELWGRQRSLPSST